MRLLAAVLTLLATCSAAAEVKVDELEWRLGEDRFRGYVLHPTTATPVPGLVMVPNWMGINESALQHAQDIAARGYVVLLADVYGADVRPTTAEEARFAASAAYADRARLRARANAALDQLRRLPDSVPLRRDDIAAIGFCFGGTTVLELARSGADIDAAVSFHGGLNTTMPAEPGAVKAAVLVLNGAADANVPTEQITEFKAEMSTAGADWQFHDFAEAVHCFSEPSANRPPNCLYNERAAKRAFRMMDAHLAEVFARP